MTTDWTPVKNLLRTNGDSLSLEEGVDRTQYVATIVDAIAKAESAENDNKRAATLIAVDAAKTFVQIAIALVIAIVGFVQFSYHSLSQISLYSLGAAASLAFLSMLAGFLVISKAYKHGDGREGKRPLWSTENLSTPINLQAWFGVLALIAFAATLANFNVGNNNPNRVVLTLPDGVTKASVAVEPIILSGSWSALAIEEKGGVAIVVPPTPANSKQKLKIEVH